MDEARHRGEFSGEIVEIPVYNTYYVEPLCPYIQYLFTESPQWLYGPAIGQASISPCFLPQL